mmetsp:Transcript_83412/g.250016  ORF Transcript_83412/g.250016 Transcript_83412/m.250016 type:complete len:244 (+) Transcript_83412:135-866(+)
MRRVLVTGAARGIGFSTALKFLATSRCRVVALDQDFSGSDLPAAIERVTYDLRNVQGIPSLVTRLGVIDTLVNNAGRLHCPPDRLPLGDLGFTDDMLMEILTVNLRAPVALIEAVAPQMIARGDAGRQIGGRIINVGSVSAFTGHPDLWYGASKAAILNVTKSFATLLGKHKVLVNAVAPGPTETAMYDSLPQSRKDMVSRTVYSGRPARPEEVAEAILWLGMDAPEYVSGTTLDCNNGSYPR